MAATASPSSRTQTTSSKSCSYSSPFASYTSTNFVSGASSLVASSSSSYRHNHCSSSPSSPPSLTSSVWFSKDQRPGSPVRQSITVAKNHQRNNGAVSSSSSHHPKRTCMCSPTTHPGSFRCAYHKRLAEQRHQRKEEQTSSSCQSSSSISGNNKLNLRRSVMTNSLVRIGGVEGELVKRALTTLIRPSSHHQRRREAFQPRPSRLSVMSKAQDS